MARAVSPPALTVPNNPRPTFPETFSLIRPGRNKKPRKASAEFTAAIERALPMRAGMGDFWPIEIAACRAAWPPVPCSTPPRECRRRGDRGRLYPGYYVRSHAPTRVRRGVKRSGYVCCLDCANEIILRDRIRWQRFEDGTECDGVATPNDEINAAAGPEVDGSASAAVLAALAAAGGELQEAKLLPEDEASLKRQIARLTEGRKTKEIIF